MQALSSLMKMCSHMASAPATDPLFPSCLPIHHEQELRGFPSNCGGGQPAGPAELDMVLPISQEEFSVGPPVSCRFWLSADCSYRTFPRKLILALIAHAYFDTRLQPPKPSIRFLLLDQGTNHHHPSRSHQPTTAMASPEQHPPTLLWVGDCIRHLQGPFYLNCWRIIDLRWEPHENALNHINTQWSTFSGLPAPPKDLGTICLCTGPRMVLPWQEKTLLTT